MIFQMPSLPAEGRERAPDEVVAIAERLCGNRIVAAETCAGGGNNRVYRVRTPTATFAVKAYGSTEVDDRDRLGQEYDGLRFLKTFGIGKALPAALAVDRQARCALYEWIDGAVAHDHGVSDIAAVADLLASMHRARDADGSSNIPEATEAVLRLADLGDQIERRLTRLSYLALAESELAAFLKNDLRPEFESRMARLPEGLLRSPLTAQNRTLSPSDFGFHNALRRADGTLGFIDFEYFGWDDPAKLTADFLWHPAMRLSAAEKTQFLAATTKLYANDPDFLSRLAVCFPLYGIRWTLIILNEFLPQLWERRTFSGKGRDWAVAKREQLLKARAYLATVHAYREGTFV
jgi:hypothetical protein